MALMESALQLTQGQLIAKERNAGMMGAEIQLDAEHAEAAIIAIQMDSA
jgi:hypothetical protein